MQKEYSRIGDLGAGVVKSVLGTAFTLSLVGAAVAVSTNNEQKKTRDEMQASYAAIDANPSTKNIIEVAPN